MLTFASGLGLTGEPVVDLLIIVAICATCCVYWYLLKL